jgi:hypothetical protein
MAFSCETSSDLRRMTAHYRRVEKTPSEKRSDIANPKFDYCKEKGDQRAG